MSLRAAINAETNRITNVDRAHRGADPEGEGNAGWPKEGRL